MLFGFKKPAIPLAAGRIDSVGIIMDGNGRWAKRRRMPRLAGHAAGAARVEEVLTVLREMGIHHVTLYAFSTENWKRPKEEVDGIMDLVYKYLREVVREKIVSDGHFAVRFAGDTSVLPEKLREECREIEAMGENKEFICYVALNYGGRDEIVRSVKRALESGEEISEAAISRHLYTSPSPDPDLIIRTGGDMRISNFLLWQSAYSEFYFTKTLWPDFDRGEVIRAVESFLGRKRRFGGLNKEDK
ncbi:MAG: di-trans,poly-cis-decaprenylcistransferase [Clostridia bacterium]|nr:di-trans,poly-cis-decaprenylcistransferase [Clostridia bacterium]